MSSKSHTKSIWWRGPASRERRAAALSTATLLALALLLLAAPVLPAAIEDDAAAPSFSIYMDGPLHGDDEATDVVMTPTAIWVAGQAANTSGALDASLTRISEATGATTAFNLWNSPNGGNDDAYDLAVKGSYIYTSGASRNTAGDLDLLVIRWNANGTPKWGKRYNGLAKQSDIATDVAVDGKGNVIVCGTSGGPNGTDWVVLKYSPSGKRLWTWRYDGAAHASDEPEEMLVDAAGNAYVAGTTVTGELMSAAYTVKLSPAGKKIWAKKYAGPEGRLTQGTALARCPSGGVYVGGQTFVVGSSYDMFLVRYSASGKRKTFELFNGAGGSLPHQLFDIAVASNGAIVGAGMEGPVNAGDPAHVVWDASGSRATWGVTVSPTHDFWATVACDGFGGYYLAGRMSAVTPTLKVLRLSLRANAGTWSWWWASFDATEREVAAIAVRGMDVAVVGTMMASPPDFDQFAYIWRY